MQGLLIGDIRYLYQQHKIQIPAAVQWVLQTIMAINIFGKNKALMSTYKNLKIKETEMIKKIKHSCLFTRT